MNVPEKAEDMSLREAIEILMAHTKKDLRGGGLGYHSIPTGTEKERAEKALARAQLYIRRRYWGGT